MGQHPLKSDFNKECFLRFLMKGLGAIRAKIGPTSDVDKISSKMYSQYVLFRNKYSYLICVSNSSQRIVVYKHSSNRICGGAVWWCRK